MTFLYTLVLIFVAAVLITVTLFYGSNVFAMIWGAPFVPSGKKRIEAAYALASPEDTDVVMDLGSGDGRILFAFAPHVKKVIGVEINPVLSFVSRLDAKRRGLKNVEVLRKDLWHIPLGEVDILVVYCIHNKMHKLKQKILNEMKPGTKVISNAFTFPDWRPAHKRDKVYMYIVPGDPS